MNRAGLAIAIAVGVATALVFGAYPELDLRVAGWFFAHDRQFAWASEPTFNLFRDLSMYFVGLFVLPAILAPLWKLVRPDRPLLIPGRAILFLLATVLAAPLLLTNVVLKDNWGRPRPREVVEFGGKEPFRSWWDPRGACPGNCSFVAGETSGAMWLIAPASLTPPAWRALAYAGALAFTAIVSVLRIGFGGHFASDVLFACVFTYLIIWLFHALLYCWRTRPDDLAIEASFTRLGAALRSPFRRA